MINIIGLCIRLNDKRNEWYTGSRKTVSKPNPTKTKPGTKIKEQTPTLFHPCEYYRTEAEQNNSNNTIYNPTSVIGPSGG